MLKRFLPLLPVLLLAGCAAPGTFTRLTPAQQPRNTDNVYPVEAAFASHQESLRWDSVKAYVLVNGKALEMRKVPIVKNRWEGVIPVPPSVNVVTYRFKFDYTYNVFGHQPQPDSTLSKVYTLKVMDR